MIAISMMVDMEIVRGLSLALKMSLDTTALNMTTVAKIITDATTTIVSIMECLLMIGLFVEHRETLQNSVALKPRSTKVAL